MYAPSDRVPLRACPACRNGIREEARCPHCDTTLMAGLWLGPVPPESASFLARGIIGTGLPCFTRDAAELSRLITKERVRLLEVPLPQLEATEDMLYRRGVCAAAVLQSRSPDSGRSSSSWHAAARPEPAASPPTPRKPMLVLGLLLLLGLGFGLHAWSDVGVARRALQLESAVADDSGLLVYASIRLAPDRPAPEPRWRLLGVDSDGYDLKASALEPRYEANATVHRYRLSIFGVQSALRELRLDAGPELGEVRLAH